MAMQWKKWDLKTPIGKRYQAGLIVAIKSNPQKVSDVSKRTEWDLFRGMHLCTFDDLPAMQPVDLDGRYRKEKILLDEEFLRPELGDEVWYLLLETPEGEVICSTDLGKKEHVWCKSGGGCNAPENY